jgi:hypothetical protein
MGEIEHENTLDAALIAAAQAVEHYEITRYGTLLAWAGELGLGEADPQRDFGRGAYSRSETHGPGRDPYQRRLGG